MSELSAVYVSFQRQLAKLSPMQNVDWQYPNLVE
jgi:hypothetical protein